MNHHDEPIDIEQYLQDEGPAYNFDIPRRDFVKMVGGGIVVLCLVPRVHSQDTSKLGMLTANTIHSQADQIGAWLHIDQDGNVTVYSGKVEMGQGTRTGLAMVVAEELNLSPSAVRMVMGDTAVCPYDMGTWGSMTVPYHIPQLRRAAASARKMLINLAAEHFGVKTEKLTLHNGKVTTKNGTNSVRFGDLTNGEQLVQEIGADVSTIPASDWVIGGKPQRNLNGEAIVTGKHRYAWDITRPSMWRARMLRPPSYGATIESIDISKAKAMRDVVVVHDGDFIGVAAIDEDTANRALLAINVRWSETEQPSSKEIYDHLRKTAQGGGGGRYRRGGPIRRGALADGFAEAQQTFDQTYSAPYIAHVPLETRAAVAEWLDDGSLNIWICSQSPFGVRSSVASAFGMPEEKVRVQMPDTGSGFGGKGQTGDVAIEAARLAKAAKRSVKITWTRQEEMTWTYFRPATIIDITSGVKRDGSITAWRLININGGGSAIDSQYTFSNVEVQTKSADSPLRQGAYRATAATVNNFARETHLDEIALSLNMDPIELRLKNLDDDRLITVMQTTADHFGWSSRKVVSGKGYGFACGFDRGGYVGTCVEITVDEYSGEVRVGRTVAAFECGAIINPENVENQVVGAIIQGLGGALFEEIDYANGRILNSRLKQYRLPRFSDVPQIETILLDRKDIASAGAGESPIICIAPAVGNAIFDATGVRLRNLPLVRNGLA